MITINSITSLDHGVQQVEYSEGKHHFVAVLADNSGLHKKSVQDSILMSWVNWRLKRLGPLCETI